jgi:uncharacterized protein YxjI
VLNIEISSRVISSGFDIRTPSGEFSAKSSSDFLADEMMIFDPNGNQIARIGAEGFASRNHFIIISGGGYYLFGRDKTAKRTWTCKGEGRLLNLSEGSKGSFSVSDGDQEIAEAKKAWLTGDYAIRVCNDADFRIVLCIFITLSIREHQGAGIEISIGD